MNTLRNFVVLAILCLAVAACGSVKESHEMDVKEAQTDLMKYNSVAQGVNKDGQVGWQLTVVGQPKIPSQTVTTQQVPVTVTTQGAPPQRPVYSRDTRAAKSVPRTPPQSPTPTVTRTEMQTTVTTSTTYPGPEVLASTGGGGSSTGHDVAAQIPGAISGLGQAAIGGHYFKAGMAALRPDQTTLSNNQEQGQGQESVNDNVLKNKNITKVKVKVKTKSGSSSSSAAAAD